MFFCGTAVEQKHLTETETKTSEVWLQHDVFPISFFKNVYIIKLERGKGVESRESVFSLLFTALDGVQGQSVKAW